MRPLLQSPAAPGDFRFPDKSSIKGKACGVNRTLVPVQFSLVLPETNCHLRLNPDHQHGVDVLLCTYPDDEKLGSLRDSLKYSCF